MVRRTRRSSTDEQPDGDDGSAEVSTDPVQQAKEACVRLLAARARSRTELHQSLLRKGFEEDTAERALARLDQVGLVDDVSFAETWVRSRHTQQGLARRALVAELRKKGVDEEVAAGAVAEVDSAAEADRARELVRKKLRSMSASVDETAKVRRLVGMLARKGYPQGLALGIVRDELHATGAECTPLDDALPE